MSTFITSLIRTIVPMVVGRLLALLVSVGIVLPDGVAGDLEATLTLALAAGYYALVRWAEAKWPQAGWLLGKASTPTYVGRGITAEEVAEALAAREVDTTPAPEGYTPKHSQ